MTIQDYRKEQVHDKEIRGEFSDSFERKELLRIYAVDVVFKGVSFKQALIAGCYFRNCTFLRCDFTGVHIKESNFKGSSFEQCDFRYSTWEKTQLDEGFLDCCLPAEENLARDLVRSLRVNYAQVGNYEAVNKAASIEVSLTGLHLYNAAYSRQAYYRSKYKGLDRLGFVWRHFIWKLLDLLWGNGESVLRVLFAGCVAVLAIALFLFNEQSQIRFHEALLLSFYGFWGLGNLDAGIAVILVITRFFLFGLFMAILVKRLSRR
ncbi:TPA: pentapeptide repeat-containing protein [Pseudomonas aeruginosa]|nr:pentapeptide repeat-containing protein [Pseudomonas aeruginosa]